MLSIQDHLALGLGAAAVKVGCQVCRASLVELVDALTKAERHGQFAGKIRFYTRVSLLIVPSRGL